MSRLTKTSLLLVVAVATSCTSWRAQLQRGNYFEACVAAEEIGKDGLHRAATERVSREYTAQMSLEARVEEVGTIADADKLGEHLLRDDYRLIEVDGPTNLTLRAWVDDESVWLPATPERTRTVLIEAVGLRASERPSPLAQAAAEEIDTKVRRFSSGTVDPRLRRKEFGAVAECPDGASDCNARRRTFNALDRAFAASAECEEPTCSKLYVVRKRWKSMGFPGARLEVSWDIEQCPVWHYVDVEASTPLAAENIAETWMRVSPPLTRCTLERFAVEGCSASAE